VEDQARAFGDHEAATGEDGPFVGTNATFPELDYPAELRSVRLSVASNGANLLVEAEVPVHAASAIAQMAQGLTLEWQNGAGKKGRLIGVGAQLQRSALTPDPDGAMRHRVVYKLSQSEIVTALGVVGSAIAADATRGRLVIRSDQAMLNLADRA